MNQPGPDGPFQRVTRAEGINRMQTFGVQQRQPGEELGVETVGLGVFGEVVPQIRRLLRRDHYHYRALASEPGRQRHPRVAGRFHHHHHLFGVGREPGPQRFEIGDIGSEPMSRPDDLSCLVCASGMVW